MKQFIEQIDRYHLEDIKNEKHPAIYVKQPNYHLLIVRFPKQQEANVVAVSYPFVIVNSKCFFYKREINDFIEFPTITDFYIFLDNLMDDVLYIVNKFHIEIEELEEKLYGNIKVNSFNTTWFGYKKNFIIFDRVLLRSNDAMQNFLKHYNILDIDLKNGFEDVGEHIQRAERSTSHALEKLDAIYSFHQNIANEKMNQTIYLLAILSGIFLPLNLIVGFFGINTTSLPFTSHSGGSYNVMLLLLGVFLTASSLLYYFKIKK